MDPYLGEIRMFAGNYPPLGWELCNGQLLAISNYDALFSLIGTTYGGDGQTTFGLPDLRGRAPMHTGPNFPQGVAGGSETVTLTQNNFPSHNHEVNVSAAQAETSTPRGNVLAEAASIVMYRDADPDVTLHPATIGQSVWQGAPYGTLGPQPHENMQPWLCLNFIIATEGIYPPRN